MLSLSSEHSATSSPEHPALPAHASPSSTGLPNDASQHPATEPPRKRSWLRLVIVLLILAAVIGGVVYRLMTAKPKEQAGPGGGRRGGGAGQVVPVSFDVAQTRTIPISLTALGTVTAYNTVTLRSRVDGQITRVNFQEGQRVKQGQLLIEIDRRPYEATLAVAQGNLIRDQANAANAQAQAQRYGQLYSAGVVSKEQTQTQESTAGQAVGTLAADRAAIQQAQVNVNYTRITSPITGVVGLRQVDVGNIVSAASTTGLVVITQVQPISVIFTLPEDQLPQVFSHMRGGHRLMAEAWDRNNTAKLATGALLTVDNQIDTTTGTAKLKAVFANEDNVLYPNQFVNIHLILENRANSLVVPAAAIQTGTQGSFVYVIDRTQGQQMGAGAGGARTGAAGQTGAGDQSTAAANAGTGAPTGGAGGGNTGATSLGGGPVGAGAGGAPADANAGGAGTGGRRGGGANGPQMSYPVHAVPVVIDSTQGTTVIIRSGLQAGQQVVTDGQEKLQDKSRVIPRPSTDMMAARQGRAANGTAGAAGAYGAAQTSDPTFNNGVGSDRDPVGRVPHGAGHAATDASQPGTGDPTAPALHGGQVRGAGGGAPTGGDGTPRQPGQRHRPGGANQ